MMKIVLIWSICLIFISIILGEIVNYQTKRKQNSVNKENKSLNSGFKFETLDFFSMFTLKLRGSWRIANGYIMNEHNFKELKNVEYRKRL